MEEKSIAGIYKHFKGDLYIVFGEGLNTETQEPYVVYRSFLNPEGKFFIRPYDNFFGMIENEDEMHNRFIKLSEEETMKEVGQLLESFIDDNTCCGGEGCDNCEDGCNSGS